MVGLGGYLLKAPLREGSSYPFYHWRMWAVKKVHYYIDPSRPDFNRSTKLTLIGPGDPEYDKPYYEYEHVYENIYELIKESHNDPNGWLLDEFDCWNSEVFSE